MCYANLKILSKQECDVYIDGEMRTVVYPDSIEKKGVILYMKICGNPYETRRKHYTKRLF